MRLPSSSRANPLPPPDADPAPVKQSIDSFSFVEDPSLRMVPALSAQPEPDDTTSLSLADPSPRTSTTSPSPSSSPLIRSSRRSSLAQGAAAMPSEHSQPALQPPPPLAGPANALPSSQASPLPPPLSAQSSEPVRRSNSKSRRKLSHSLGSLLKGKRRSDDQAVGGGVSATTTGGSSASAGTIRGGEGGATSPRESSSRRQSVDNGRPAPVVLQSPPSSSTAPFDPSSSISSSTSRSSKPPVSLPHLFRRRHSGSQPAANGNSSSADLHPSSSSSGPVVGNGSAAGEVLENARRSLEATRLGSDSSFGSSAVADGEADSPSLVSTAPTSPDQLAFAPSVQSPVEIELNGEERRRRGSEALVQELSNGTALGEEELADFVAASGSLTASPTSTSGPFSPILSPRPSYASSPPPQAVSPAASPLLAATVSPSRHPSIAVRRGQTPNIEGLSLSDLRPTSPSSLPASAVPAAVATTASPPNSSPETSTPETGPSQPGPSTRTRLGALPRLFSTAAISTQAISGDEEQEHDEESETDTDADDSSEEDEGERYRTSDEGPVTTRSRDVTPAQTPLPLTPRGRPAGLGGQSGRSSRMPSLTGLSMVTATTGPSGWVSFAPSTPTPSIRTTRPNLHVQTNCTSTPSTSAAPYSYFDIPRPLATTTASPTTSTARTPLLSSLIPPQTPLAPMSLSEIARGKRPAWQEEVDASSSAAATAEGEGGRAVGAAAEGEEEDKAVRAGMYRMRSQSVVALASPSMVDDGAGGDNHPVGTAALTGLDPVWQTGGGMKTPGPSFLNLSDLATKVQTSPPQSQSISPVRSAPKTPLLLNTSLDLPSPPGSPPSAAASIFQPSQPASPARASRPSTAAGPNRGGLHRRRSMFELRDAPPAYAAVYRRPGLAPQVIEPRDDEGNEGLPGYTCSIHIEGYMPRKMEFTAPGVQAKDRAWKRQYVVLHGTSIKVYKYDLRTHPIPGEEDWSVVPKDIAGHDGPPPLHFHEGEYGVDGSSASGAGGGAAAVLHHKFPLSIGDAKAKAKSRIMEGAAAAAQNQLLRHYSLQNAESGLAADYLKRKHVVRVRAEGEQFLLQARDDRGVIDLIEALQAATNVALDLDARPLPKFITLPRRRRRRRPRPDGANGTTTTGAGTNGSAATEGAAPASTSAGGAAAGGGGREDRMGDMLAEEQNAYARTGSGTVM